MPTLYFAYGSNLNKPQMYHRCPAAKPLCKLQLRDYILVFRGVADITPSPGDFVNGGVWKITDECEERLDAYEGVASGLYRKEYLPIDPIEIDGEWYDSMLVYMMNSTGIFPPSKFYLQSIRDGYADFALPIGPLTKAVEASHDDKAPSHVERQRHMRKGRPELATRPSEKKAKPVKRPVGISKAQQRANAKAAAKAKPAGGKRKDQAQGKLDLGAWGKAMTIYGD